MDLLAGHMEMYTALHTQNVSAECQATSPSWLTDNVPRSGQKNQPTSQAFLLNMDMEQTTGSLLHFDPDDSLTKDTVADSKTITQLLLRPTSRLPGFLPGLSHFQ